MSLKECHIAWVWCVAFNFRSLHRPQWISFELDDVFNSLHFTQQKLHLQVCCDNTILRKGPSSSIAPFTGWAKSRYTESIYYTLCTVYLILTHLVLARPIWFAWNLMHRDMASLDVLQLSPAASFTSRLISDFRMWACNYFFLKDKWMGENNACYQFRPTAKVTVIRKGFSVTRFDKKKCYTSHTLLGI